MTKQGLRIVRAGAVAAMVVLATTGCEPAPPRPTLVVNTETTGADATPGDGICEVTSGGGDCSLRAAVEEGNALGRARIDLPTGAYSFEATTVTGDLVIVGDVGPGPLEMPLVYASDVGVAASGRLELQGLYGGGDIAADGIFVGRDLYLGTLGPPVVTVQVGGTAVIENSILFNVHGQAAVTNHGTAVFRFSALNTGPDSDYALVNHGVVYAAASHLHRCGGTSPTSLGYNADSNGSCYPSGSTDRPLTPLRYTNPSAPWTSIYQLESASPLVDAIPVGTYGCGAEVPDDLFGTVRPSDGNGDGIQGCDIGAIELPASP